MVSVIPQGLFRLLSGGDGVIDILEATDKSTPDKNNPFFVTRMVTHTCASGFISRASCGIKSVLMGCNRSKIDNPVISSDAIDVINLIRHRVPAKNPNHTMRVKSDTRKPACLIPVLERIESELACKLSIPRKPRILCREVGLRPKLPNKQPLMRVAIHTLTKKLMCEIKFVSHSVLPHVFGQGRIERATALRPESLTNILHARKPMLLAHEGDGHGGC